MDLAWCLVCEKKLQSDKNLYCSTQCQMLDFQMPTHSHYPHYNSYSHNEYSRSRAKGSVDYDSGWVSHQQKANTSGHRFSLILPQPETSPSSLSAPIPSASTQQPPLVFEIHPLDFSHQKLNPQHHQKPKRRPFLRSRFVTSSPSSESLSSSSSSNASSPTPSLGSSAVSSSLRSPPIKKLLNQSNPPRDFDRDVIESSHLPLSSTKTAAKKSGILDKSPLDPPRAAAAALSRNEREGESHYFPLGLALLSIERTSETAIREHTFLTSKSSPPIVTGSSPLGNLASWKRAAFKNTVASSYQRNTKVPVSFPPHSSYVLHLGR